MEKKIEVQCPMCGVKFNALIALHAIKTVQIIECYSDDAPTCGELFVLEHEIQIKTQTSRIERIKK